MYNFNVANNVELCIQWIKNWFENNGKDCNAIIGMSGGKDSTVAAALIAKAIGPDRVIGVAMPDNGQGINDADKICEYLGIHYVVAPIASMVKAHIDTPIIFDGVTLNGNWGVQSEQNIPPRERMIMLYKIAQKYNGRPVNTCNVSEDYLGYATLFGDSAGSFSPICGMTVTEILAIGDYLGLPYEWVHKTPDDGLPHSTSDEIKFGFSYAEVDKYIREGIEPVGKCNNSDELKIDKIKRMYNNNKFKTEIIHIPHFEPII